MLRLMVPLSALGLVCCSDSATRDPLDAHVSLPPPVVTQARGRRVVGKPYRIAGRWYVPHRDPAYNRTGIASWYGIDFHGRTTANGEIYDINRMTAAHTTLPLPSYVQVTNLENGRSMTLRVNDRGPFVDNRIIDVSARAAAALGFKHAGLARVRVRYLAPAPLSHD